jgi:hypothetical protein
VQEHACVQILAVLSHIDRFAIASLFMRWALFGSLSDLSTGGPRRFGPAAAGIDACSNSAGSSRRTQSPPYLLPEAIPLRARTPSPVHLASAVRDAGEDGSGGSGGDLESTEHRRQRQAATQRDGAIAFSGRRAGFRPPTHAARGKSSAFADIEEVLGERGEGLATEMLVRWRGIYSARPSWALLSNLRKNASFTQALAEYRTAGARVFVELESR